MLGVYDHQKKHDDEPKQDPQDLRPATSTHPRHLPPCGERLLTAYYVTAPYSNYTMADMGLQGPPPAGRAWKFAHEFF